MSEEVAAWFLKEHGTVGVGVAILYLRQQKILNAISEYDPITVERGILPDGGPGGGGKDG